MFLTAERIVIDPTDFVPTLVVLTDNPSSAMLQLREFTAVEPRPHGMKPFYGMQLHCLSYPIAARDGGEGCTGDEVASIIKTFPRKKIVDREWSE